MRQPVRSLIKRCLATMVLGPMVGVLAAMAGSAPANAAVADAYAFAYLDNQTPPANYVMDTTRQWGTFKIPCPTYWMTASTVGVGVYRIQIPCTAGPGGVVHVTAVDAAGRFCQPTRWGPSGTDEWVYVRCFDAGGLPSYARFTVLYTRSSGTAATGGHAYVFADGAGAAVYSFNSTGGAVTVTRNAPGAYRVELRNLAPGDYAGNLQVTAAVDAPRRCRVADWAHNAGTYLAYVTCTDWAGTNADSYFSLSYHRERAVFGSVAPPWNFAYVAAGWPSPATNYNSVAGPNTVTPVAAGNWDVRYPGVGVRETHIQVTAFSGSAAYCQLANVWTIAGTDVNSRVVCFAPGGAPIDRRFFATYSSRA